MKLKHLVLSLSLIGFAGNVFAATDGGTINFKGYVTDTTCKVEVDGKDDNAIITLPTVSSSLLKTANATAGDTRFNMTVSDCTAAEGEDPEIKSVSAFFKSGATVNPETGRLLQQTADGAKNVSLQLLDVRGSNTPINVGSSDQMASASYVDLPAEGETATLPYAVRYYAEAPVTAGPVTSLVEFNLMYK